MIFNVDRSQQNEIKIGTERIVEKFALWPRRINDKQVAWLENVKVTEVYSEVIHYGHDYMFGVLYVSKKWVEKC